MMWRCTRKTSRKQIGCHWQRSCTYWIQPRHWHSTAGHAHYSGGSWHADCAASGKRTSNQGTSSCRWHWHICPSVTLLFLWWHHFSCADGISNQWTHNNRHQCHSGETPSDHTKPPCRPWPHGLWHCCTLLWHRKGRRTESVAWWCTSSWLLRQSSRCFGQLSQSSNQLHACLLWIPSVWHTYRSSTKGLAVKSREEPGESPQTCQSASDQWGICTECGQGASSSGHMETCPWRGTTRDGANWPWLGTRYHELASSGNCPWRSSAGPCGVA